MPNIQDTVERIDSVTSTQQITQAMKMVAASKLGKVQQQVLQLRPYAQKLDAILHRLLASTHANPRSLAKPYLLKRPLRKMLVIVVASDRGLCGAFNNNLLKKTNQYLTSIKQQGAVAVDVLPIGKKALQFFKKQAEGSLIDTYVDLIHHVTFSHVAQLSKWSTQAFLQSTYDRVVLAYNYFKNAAVQEVTINTILPIASKQLQGTTTLSSRPYIYEPTKAALLAQLIPQWLDIHFYKALLESSASEHGARMTTMAQATDNADELLQTLRITYNRTRQALITREISEIVAGVEALSSTG